MEEIDFFHELFEGPFDRRIINVDLKDICSKYRHQIYVRTLYQLQEVLQHRLRQCIEMLHPYKLAYQVYPRVSRLVRQH